MTTAYPITIFKFGEARECKDSGEEARARADGFCEPYSFQEYPRSLYRGDRVHHELTGDVLKEDHRIVKDKAEEAAARAEGYRLLDEPKAEVKAKKAA